jgi:hypothetical protein
VTDVKTPTTEQRVAAMFATNTAEHELKILHDDGVYRHILMAKPGTGIYRYELITWPGHLAVGGDMDTYVFARVDDMFTFFRRQQINPSYWAEKVQDGRERTQRYSEDKFRALVKEEIDEHAEAYPDLAAKHARQLEAYKAAHYTQQYPYNGGGVRHPGPLWSPEEAREALADAEADGSTMHEEGARELLGQLESNGVTSDIWERSLSDWDWHFLYCLNAIVAGIAAYDAAKAATS